MVVTNVALVEVQFEIIYLNIDVFKKTTLGFLLNKIMSSIVLL